MKKVFILGLLMMGLVSCADKGPVAPKEGRQSVGEILSEPVQSTETVKADKPQSVTTWAFINKNATNRKPQATIRQFPKFVRSVSIGKGINEDNQTLGGPVVLSGIIYTLDSRFTLQATELKTGKILWRQSLANITGTTAKSIGLAIYHQKLYAVAGNGLIVALNLSGKQIWKRELNIPLRSNPILDSNRLFVSSIHNQLFVLNADNGQELWHYTGERSITNFFGMGEPAVRGNITVMPTTDGRVNAFDTTTGMTLWSQDMWTKKTYNPILDIPHVTAAPVIDTDTVYLVGNAGKTGAFHLTTGMPIFTTGIGGRETPAIGGNALYIVTNQKELVALDKKEGRLFWKTTLNASD
ncbi:MAG: PQQ-binding-like beta-propeller repeat protein, partial [Pseudomonadota bacterium]|nr:PQQ-binding-like beta-propeller repeat protein [Pseudomonadota bacterium]